MANEDLTRVGHVPKKQGARGVHPLMRTYHCIDHTGFKDSCHPCLLVATIALAEKLSVLESVLHKEITEASRGIPYSVKPKDPGKTHWSV